MQALRSEILAGLTLDGRWPCWHWIAVGIVALIDLFWLVMTPLSLSQNSLSILCGLAPLVLLGALVSVRFRASPRFQLLSAGLCFLLVAWPALRLYNHLTMSTAMPMSDDMLARLDATIGFNWFAYVSWLDQYPRLLGIMSRCYTGLTGYSIVIYLLLITTDHFEAACRELIQLFVILAIACSTIGALFPALTAILYYQPPPDAFIHIAPGTGAYHITYLSGLRTDAAHVLDLSDLPGLVTIPSFHTAMGVAAIYCARRTLWLFLPALAVNGLMIASTPVFGSHYGVDVIAGMLVAGFSIAMIRYGSSIRKDASYFRVLRVFSNVPGYSR